MSHPPSFPCFPSRTALFLSVIAGVILALLPVAAPALSLAELVDTALGANIPIKRAQLQVEHSRIDEQKARNALIPNLDAEINDSRKTYLDSQQKSGPFSFGVTQTVSLKLSQSYPGLGKIPRIQQEVAAMRTLARQISLEQSRLQAASEIVTPFFEMLRERAKMGIHEENLFLLGKLMEVARINQQVGIALPNDILRIEVQTSRTRNSLNRSRNEADNRRVDIEAVLACVGSGTLEVTLPATPTFCIASLTLEQATEQMISRDFDLALIANDAAIFRKGIKAAHQASLPTLDVNSNYTYGPKVMGMKNTRDYTVTLGLSFPVYDSGDLRNEIRRAEKTLAELELALADLMNRKKAVLTKYFNDYHEAIERISVAAKASEQSRENMRMVMTRYEHGATSIVELVDAQLTLSTTEEEAVDARIDERLRLADILFATHDLDIVKKLDCVPGDNK